jgi:hypothetical protein
MVTVPVTTYNAVSSRIRDTRNGRYITLTVQPSGTAITSVRLLYFGVISIGNVSPPLVYAYFWPETFSVHLAIVQSESPLFFNWQADPQGHLIVAALSTSEEWPGEGPADTSP